MLKALIFDVDGTLADTEMAHLFAFNQAFRKHNIDWQWDAPLYIRLLETSGGKERIKAYWNSLAPDQRAISADDLDHYTQLIHQTKTSAYEKAVLDGHVQMRPGVLELIEEARQNNIRLAIATTTSPANIRALLQKALGENWQSYFEVIEDASSAPNKKPDPSVYLQALKRLGLDADQCVAIEDSSNGLKAAVAAHIPTIITTNTFTAHHNFDKALCVLPDLQNSSLKHITQWHASAWETS